MDQTRKNPFKNWKFSKKNEILKKMKNFEKMNEKNLKLWKNIKI